MRAVAAALKHRCWLAHHAAPRLGAEFVSVRRETVEAGQVFGARCLGPGVWGQVFGANCLGPVSRLSVRQSAHETGPQLRRGAGCRLSIDGMAYAIWTSRVYYAFNFGNAIKRALSRLSGIVARGA